MSNALVQAVVYCRWLQLIELLVSHLVLALALDVAYLLTLPVNLHFYSVDEFDGWFTGSVRR